MSAAVAADLPRAAPACCLHCRHREEARQRLEPQLPGMASFGSAYGATVAESRLCGLHDCWVSPRDTCSQFERKG
ncbi:hypothetical protein DVT68_12300 [Dyella solisilvae]|uniref:Uncharacterized protein n=1 Tax=Dyella solisilvae TaxID=1920168 RepID=A0A370K604_9GAMM|nr:hypothetical protein DVT68_12300 [Dyella solisilvae]